MAFTTTTGAGGTSLIGTSGVDTASLTSSTFNLYIGAQAANDVISFAGSTTNARVELGKGADLLTAAGLETSTISGNFGNDTITISGTVSGSSALVNGNQGVDTFTLTGATIKSGARILGGADNDTINVDTATISTGGIINGNKGDDSITVATSATAMSASTIFGGEGNDIFMAADVAVVFSGDNGADSISGSTGADTLFGGAGNDTIRGDDAGIDGNIDSLIGGDGNDIYYFLGNTGATETTVNTAGDTADIITDFVVSGDKINTATAYAFGGVVDSAATALTDNVLYAVSGTLDGSDFTAKAVSAGGFDTLIAVGKGGGVDVNNDETLVLLKGVLASTLTAGNFTA